MDIINLINQITVKRMVSSEYNNPIDLFLEMDKFIKTKHAYSSKDKDSKETNFTIKDKRFDEFEFNYKGKKLPFKTVYGYWEIMSAGLKGNESNYQDYAKRLGKDYYDFGTILDIIVNDFLIDYRDFYNNINTQKYEFIANLTNVFLMLNKTWNLYHRTMIGDDLLEGLRERLRDQRDYESLSDMLITFLNSDIELARASDKKFITRVLTTLKINEQKHWLIEVLENSLLYFEDEKVNSLLSYEDYTLLFEGILHESEEDNLIDEEIDGVYLELYSSFINDESSKGVGYTFLHKEILSILIGTIRESNNETAKEQALISFWNYLSDYDRLSLLKELLNTKSEKSINRIMEILKDYINKSSIKEEVEEGIKLIHKRS